MISRRLGIAIKIISKKPRTKVYRPAVRNHGQSEHSCRQLPPCQSIILNNVRAQVYLQHGLNSRVSRRYQSYHIRSAGRAINPGVIENEAIKSFKVCVVNADNKIGEPRPLFDALKAREKDEKGRFTEVLRQVQPASPSTMFPICKYFSLKSLREKELAQQKQERADQATKRQTKQLELNWTIGQNDLEHRMERLKEFLGKGRSVEVTLGTQRKKGWQRRKPQSEESAQSLIDKVKESALEVKGTKESKAMTGQMSELVVLYFEGPRKAKEPASR